MRICCIIKPPHVLRTAEIVFALANKGIVTVVRRCFVYSRHSINVLYDHMDDESRTLIANRYGGKAGCALLLEFESIEQCMQMVGMNSDPCACASDTIRAQFGDRSEALHAGAWAWWENALHRPVDERERLRDLKLIFPEYTLSADN